jgi:hypothetical protein
VSVAIRWTESDADSELPDAAESAARDGLPSATDSMLDSVLGVDSSSSSSSSSGSSSSSSSSSGSSSGSGSSSSSRSSSSSNPKPPPHGRTPMQTTLLNVLTPLVATKRIHVALSMYKVRLLEAIRLIIRTCVTEYLSDFDPSNVEMDYASFDGAGAGVGAGGSTAKAASNGNGSGGADKSTSFGQKVREECSKMNSYHTRHTLVILATHPKSHFCYTRIDTLITFI